MRLARLMAATALMLALSVPAQGACRLALALGLDISSSVNEDEYRLQLDGLANALRDDAVIQAILTPEGTHIAAAAYEWSGYQQQDLLIDWTVLDSPAAIRSFAARLQSTQRRYAAFATALGKGVEFGAHLLHRSPACARKVLDVSGDGENNVGVGPGYFRRIGLLQDLTINGLVIMGAVPDPSLYYRAEVIQGPNSFIALADDFNDYRRAMTGKLIREIGDDLILGLNP